MKTRQFNNIFFISIVLVFVFIAISYAEDNSRSLFKNKKVDYQKLSTESEEKLDERKASLKTKNIQVNLNKSQPAKIVPQQLKELSNLYLPDSLGRVIEVHQPDNPGQQKNRFIVHIQDLHTNPEAQLNAASILELLIKDYDLGLVCSEGAEGEVDTSSVSSFPDPAVREKTARLFVDSGELTGEEYISITKYPDLPIWGVENKDLYFQNITEFNKIMRYTEKAMVFVNGVQDVLDGLKPKIYSKDLLALDKKSEEYGANKIETNEYLKYLLALSPTAIVNNQGRFKNITLLQETTELEKIINQDNVKQESQKLLSSLQNTLSQKGNKTEIEVLLGKATLFKDQKISPFSFYSYLSETADRYLKEEMINYSGLMQFVGYLKKVNSLDSVKLFNEVDELSYDVKNAISVNEDQRLLTKSLRHIKLLGNFFNLKLSNEELDYYLADKEQWTAGWFKATVTNLAGKAGQIDRVKTVDFNANVIDLRLPELENFYDIAKERDTEMIKNALNEIERRNVKTAAIIAGGFHTRGLTDVLREKGYSYAVVIPYSSTEIDEENYKMLLSGKRRPITDLIEQVNSAKSEPEK